MSCHTLPYPATLRILPYHHIQPHCNLSHLTKSGAGVAGIPEKPLECPAQKGRLIPGYEDIKIIFVNTAEILYLQTPGGKYSNNGLLADTIGLYDTLPNVFCTGFLVIVAALCICLFTGDFMVTVSDINSLLFLFFLHKVYSITGI